MPSGESLELSRERGQNVVCQAFLPGPLLLSPADGTLSSQISRLPGSQACGLEKLPSERLGPWRTRVSAPVWPFFIRAVEADSWSPGARADALRVTGGVSRFPKAVSIPALGYFSPQGTASSFQSSHTTCRETGVMGLRPSVGSAGEDGQVSCRLLAAGRATSYSQVVGLQWGPLAQPGGGKAL